MVSAGELGDELRRIAVNLPLGALAEGLGYLESVQLRVTQVVDGSMQPEARELIGLLGQLVQAAQEAQQLTANAQARIEAFAGTVGSGAGAGSGTAGRPVVGGAGGGRAATSASDADAVPALVWRQIDAGVVAEIQRAGHKISPERVVRTGRDQTDRAVWLEIGTIKAGLTHLMQPDRVAEFGGQGIAREDIIDVVFQAITTGRQLGTSGVNRPVFAVPYQGREVWVAVTVGSNGFVVGANPIRPGAKLKQPKESP